MSEYLSRSHMSNANVKCDHIADPGINRSFFTAGHGGIMMTTWFHMKPAIVVYMIFAIDGQFYYETLVEMKDGASKITVTDDGFPSVLVPTAPVIPVSITVKKELRLGSGK
jgi:hypothetical protein